MVAVTAMVPPEPNCHARVTPSLLSSVAECCGYKSPASGPVAPGRVGGGEGDTGPYAAWGLVTDADGVRDAEGVREAGAAGAAGVATNSVGFGEGPNEGDTTALDVLSAALLAASGEGKALRSGDVESGDAPPSGMPTVGDGDAAVSGTLTPTEKLMLTTCSWVEAGRASLSIMAGFIVYRQYNNPHVLQHAPTAICCCSVLSERCTESEHQQQRQQPQSVHQLCCCRRWSGDYCTPALTFFPSPAAL